LVVLAKDNLTKLEGKENPVSLDRSYFRINYEQKQDVMDYNI
jgi:hypothetical protein